MDKKQKIFIISISVVVVLLIVALIVYVVTKKETESVNDNRLSTIYDKMMQNETYQVTFKLDDNNQYTVSRKGNVANIDTYSDGSHTTEIIKDGNTNLLMYSTKRYYTYQNNEIGLTELATELNDIIQSQEPEKGEEEIDGKTYKYEEYKGVSYFLMNANDEVSEEDTNTRFYFKGDKLQYIKTIMGEKSELLQVNVSYNVDNSLFEIPADFQEG